MHYWLWLFLCVFGAPLLQGVAGLKVIIDYSFRVPEAFGVATPESANCCPFGKLPDNDTRGMTVPTIIGIGVQKGGTTTLYAHWQNHHQVHGATKEMHYLDAANAEPYHAYLHRWHWNRNGPKKIVEVNHTLQSVSVAPPIGGLYEISPSYLLVPFSACKVKVMSPNAKFIVFLRDPAERAYSGLSYTFQVMRRHARRAPPGWMRRSFWSLVRQGILELEQEPQCDFQTGKGVYDYNDCAGCMLRWTKVQGRCAFRPFVTLKDDHMNFNCTFVGKEHLLRGYYGPQLAWWFTLHHPSQFKIVNSNDFFKDTLGVLKDIGKFLGLNPGYAKWMMERSAKAANVGHYRRENPKMVDFTKDVLREFYMRPNLELYRLLTENGHEGFEPFEKHLEGVKLLNCSDYKAAKTGVCGDVRFLDAHPATAPPEARIPERVSHVVHLVSSNKKSKGVKKTAALSKHEKSKVVSPVKEPNVKTAVPLEAEVQQVSLYEAAPVGSVESESLLAEAPDVASELELGELKMEPPTTEPASEAATAETELEPSAVETVPEPSAAASDPVEDAVRTVPGVQTVFEIQREATAEGGPRVTKAAVADTVPVAVEEASNESTEDAASSQLPSVEAAAVTETTPLSVSRTPEIEAPPVDTVSAPKTETTEREVVHEAAEEKGLEGVVDLEAQEETVHQGVVIVAVPRHDVQKEIVYPEDTVEGAVFNKELIAKGELTGVVHESSTVFRGRRGGEQLEAQLNFQRASAFSGVLFTVVLSVVMYAGYRWTYRHRR